MTRCPSATSARILVAILLPGVLACGAASPGSASPPAPDAVIAELHERKCGQCHSPPEPKTRTRDHLETAFKRHKNRVHLTPAQWAAMTDYLVAPPGATASHVR